MVSVDTDAADAPARERVLVAMSGGVDSSVAAALLVRQGYDVVGATMKLFCYGDDVPDRPCCSLDSINDARRVCQALGVPHYVLNLEDRFGAVAEGLLAARSVCIADAVPQGLALTDVAVTADSLDASFDLSPTFLSDPAQQETGVCS